MEFFLYRKFCYDTLNIHAFLYKDYMPYKKDIFPLRTGHY